jgi:hypothetical protein
MQTNHPQAAPQPRSQLLRGADEQPGSASPPTLEALLQEWKQANRLLESGELAAFSGQYVAVVDGQVVGHGEHEDHLRQQCANRCGIHPERVVILYVDAGG